MPINFNIKKLISLSILFVFLANTIGPMPVYAHEFRLPAPGQMVALSPAFSPAVLKGIKLDPKNPFRFHFFVDKGEVLTRGHVPEGAVSPSPMPSDAGLSARAPQGNNQPEDQELRVESSKLIKYFLASLTIPEKDLWVNLSPYEKDRIVPQEFGQTEMGRDLLAQDYLLKQITASLIYPESKLGQEFWQKVYKQAQAKYGTTNIPINTFNKVWIVPEKAVVYENKGVAFVLENHLKVMLEQDYLALEKNQRQPGDMALAVSPSPLPSDAGLSARAPQGNSHTTNESINTLGSQIVREIVIPALTREVNQGKNFAQLRQVFYSLILATWYKKKIKDSILNKIYSNQDKIGNLSSPNVSVGDPQHIYQQYLQAFKKGVYNYIKEEADPITNQTVSRKYFSGGVNAQLIREDLAMVGPKEISPAQMANIAKEKALIEISGDFSFVMSSAGEENAAEEAFRRKILESARYVYLKALNAANVDQGTLDNMVSQVDQVGSMCGYFSDKLQERIREVWGIKAGIYNMPGHWLVGVTYQGELWLADPTWRQFVPQKIRSGFPQVLLVKLRLGIEHASEMVTEELQRLKVPMEGGVVSYVQNLKQLRPADAAMNADEAWQKAGDIFEQLGENLRGFSNDLPNNSLAMLRHSIANLMQGAKSNFKAVRDFGQRRMGWEKSSIIWDNLMKSEIWIDRLSADNEEEYVIKSQRLKTWADHEKHQLQIAQEIKDGQFTYAVALRAAKFKIAWDKEGSDLGVYLSMISHGRERSDNPELENAADLLWKVRIMSGLVGEEIIRGDKNAIGFKHEYNLNVINASNILDIVIHLGRLDEETQASINKELYLFENILERYSDMSKLPQLKAWATAYLNTQRLQGSKDADYMIATWIINGGFTPFVADRVAELRDYYLKHKPEIISGIESMKEATQQATIDADWQRAGEIIKDLLEKIHVAGKGGALTHAEEVWHFITNAAHDFYSQFTVVSDFGEKQFNSDNFNFIMTALSTFELWLDRLGDDTQAGTERRKVWADWVIEHRDQIKDKYTIAAAMEIRDGQLTPEFIQSIVVLRAEFKKVYPELLTILCRLKEYSNNGFSKYQGDVSEDLLKGKGIILTIQNRYNLVEEEMRSFGVDDEYSMGHKLRGYFQIIQAAFGGARDNKKLTTSLKDEIIRSLNRLKPPFWSKVSDSPFVVDRLREMKNYLNAKQPEFLAILERLQDKTIVFEAEAPRTGIPQPVVGKVNGLLSGYKVLMIDDDDVITKTTVFFLHRGGADAQGETNFAHAVEVAASEHYDLVILDINNKAKDDISAFEVVRRIRKQAPHVPVLLVTGFQEDGLPNMLSKGLGMDFKNIFALSKPYDLKNELPEKIKNILAGNAQPLQAPVPKSEGQKIIDPSGDMTDAQIDEFKETLSEKAWKLLDMYRDPQFPIPDFFVLRSNGKGELVIDEVLRKAWNRVKKEGREVIGRSAHYMEGRKYPFSGQFESFKGLKYLSHEEALAAGETDPMENPVSLEIAYKQMVWLAHPENNPILKKYLDERNIRDFVPEWMDMVVMTEHPLKTFAMFLTSNLHHPNRVNIHYQSNGKSKPLATYDLERDEFDRRELKTLRPELIAFARMAFKVQHKYGRQQIEVGFSQDDGKVYLLQSRSFRGIEASEVPKYKEYLPGLASGLIAEGYAHVQAPIIVVDELEKAVPDNEEYKKLQSEDRELRQRISAGELSGDSNMADFKQRLDEIGKVFNDVRNELVRKYAHQIEVRAQGKDYILVLSYPESLALNGGTKKEDLRFLEEIAGKAKVIIGRDDMNMVGHAIWDPQEAGGTIVTVPQGVNLEKMFGINKTGDIFELLSNPDGVFLHPVTPDGQGAGIGEPLSPADGVIKADMPQEKQGDHKGGQVVVLIGPSGSGKSTFRRKLITETSHGQLFYARIVTNRKPLEHEPFPGEFVFLSPKEFDEQEQDGKIIFVRENFGGMYKYGNYVADIKGQLSLGKTVVLETSSPDAVGKIKEQYPSAQVVLFSTFDNTRPEDENIADLGKRLKQRGVPQAEIARRTRDARDILNEVRRFTPIVIQNPLSEDFATDPAWNKQYEIFKKTLDAAMNADRVFQYTDGHGHLRLNSFALPAVPFPGKPPKEKVTVMTEALSEEVIHALQAGGYLDSALAFTSKLDLNIDYDRMNDFGIDEVDGKTLETILGLDRKFSLIFADILMILRQAAEEMNASIMPESMSVNNGAEPKKEGRPANQVYWFVEVKTAQGVTPYIVHIRNTLNAGEDGESNKKISYDIFATPLSEYNKRKIKRDDYKGYVLLNFSNGSILSNDTLEVLIQKNRRQAFPWLFGFVKNRLAQQLNKPFDLRNPDLQETPGSALRYKEYFVDETVLDTRFLDLLYEKQFKAYLETTGKEDDQTLRYQDSEKAGLIDQHAVPGNKIVNIGSYKDCMEVREMSSFINQTLRDHGYEAAVWIDQKDMLIQGDKVVNIGLLGGLQEDELSLMQAASHFENINLFFIEKTEQWKPLNGKGHALVAGAPYFMFKDGKPVLNRSPKPVPLRYVINHLGPKFDRFRNSSGIPTADHPLEDQYIGLKDITMIELEKRGVKVPRWRAILGAWGENDRLSLKRKSSGKVSIVQRDHIALGNQIYTELKDFLDQNGIDKGVAKPINGIAGYDVVFFDRLNLKRDAEKIWNMVHNGRDIMIQERIEPPYVMKESKALDWNLRVFVTGNEKGRLAKVVRIDQEGKAINISQSAQPWLLEKVVRELGLTLDEYRQMERAIDEESRKVFKAINQSMEEDGVKPETENATDFMGVDIIVRREGDQFIPYVIEANDFHSGALWDLDKVLKEAPAEGLLSPQEAARRIGEASQGWLETMYKRGLAYKNGDSVQVSNPVDGATSGRNDDHAMIVDKHLLAKALLATVLLGSMTGDKKSLMANSPVPVIPKITISDIPVMKTTLETLQAPQNEKIAEVNYIEVDVLKDKYRFSLLNDVLNVENMTSPVWSAKINMKTGEIERPSQTSKMPGETVLWYADLNNDVIGPLKAAKASLKSAKNNKNARILEVYINAVQALEDKVSSSTIDVPAREQDIKKDPKAHDYRFRLFNNILRVEDMSSKTWQAWNVKIDLNTGKIVTEWDGSEYDQEEKTWGKVLKYNVLIPLNTAIARLKARNDIANASKVGNYVRAIEKLQHPKYGDSAQLSIPADEAMTAGYDRLDPFWLKVINAIDITQELGRDNVVWGEFPEDFRFEKNGFQPGPMIMGIGGGRIGDTIMMRRSDTEGQQKITFERWRNGELIKSAAWIKLEGDWMLEQDYLAIEHDYMMNRFWAGLMDRVDATKKLGYGVIDGKFPVSFRFEKTGFQPLQLYIGIGKGMTGDTVIMRQSETEGLKRVIFERWRNGGLIKSAAWVKTTEKEMGTGHYVWKRDPAMNGGIDLNPAQMSLQVKQQGEDFKFNFNGAEIDAAQVTGVTFTIRQITPVTDLPQILGLNQEAANKANLV